MRRLLRSSIEYVALWIGLGLLGVVCLLWLPFSFVLQRVVPRASSGRLGRRTNMFWLRFYAGALQAIGACRFDLAALDALRGQPPMILAPNHPGLLDALLIISRLPNVVCIMKAAILDNPLLRSGARFAQYIGNGSLSGMVRQSAEALHDGNHLLLFPEGTRTVHPPVNAFTAAVGLIARRAGVPVQTVLIEANSNFLGKGWPLFRRPDLPVRIRIRLGRRFDPPDDVRAFTTELERYFEQELGTAAAGEVSVGSAVSGVPAAPASHAGPSGPSGPNGLNGARLPVAAPRSALPVPTSPPPAAQPEPANLANRT